MATRIEDKSRPTKRPIMTGNWSTGGSSFTLTAGKPHRVDKRGFTAYAGVPHPVIASVTEVA